MKEQAGRIGNLPANINIMNPVPNKDAKTITGLIRKNGKVSGYELSDGRVLSKREGVALAKQGGIRGVAIASRNGSEYLRSLPDEMCIRDRAHPARPPSCRYPWPYRG